MHIFAFFKVHHHFVGGDLFPSEYNIICFSEKHQALRFCSSSHFLLSDQELRLKASQLASSYFQAQGAYTCNQSVKVTD